MLDVAGLLFDVDGVDFESMLILQSESQYTIAFLRAFVYVCICMPVARKMCKTSRQYMMDLDNQGPA